MKQTLALSVLLSALLAACSSTPTQPAKVETRDTTTTTQAPASDIKDNKVVTATPAPAETGSKWAVLKDPSNILSKRSVFFDFDSYVVKTEFVPLVEAHGKFIKANGDAKVLIQGNADERGSSEYNLALGQKRADAVKKNLALLGVPESQVESVSLGKEKPRNPGHDEAAWAENRRSDILYNGEF